MTAYEQLPPSTRVWVYQSNKPFADAQIPEIRKHIQAFATKWVSHNRQLHSFADILHNRFIVLMVDESQAGASGCSIDASVHFLQALQNHYQVDLFDRMVFSYKNGEKVVSVPREEFAALYEKGEIGDNTPVFDNLVSTKADFEAQWVKPLVESWHKQMV